MEEAGSMSNLLQEVRSTCERFRIVPEVDFKDQHFLVDREVVEAVVKAADIKESDFVIEVGPGLGHLTEELAKRADNVLAIEIDQQFEGPLGEIQERQPSLRVVYGSVLEMKLPPCNKVVASLPFSILEPFVAQLVKARFSLATLVAGKRFSYEIQAEPRDANYGRLSGLVQRGFETEIVIEIPKTSFWPQPRVNSALINLRPRALRELREEPVKFIVGEVVLQPDKKVKNALREALIRFEGLRGRTGTKRQAMEVISKLGLSPEILEKMPDQLSNKELQLLGKKHWDA